MFSMTMIGVHNRHVEFAQQRDEFPVAKAVVAHLDDVTQRLAAELCRQQFEEAAEVAGIDGCELPEQGTEMPAEFGYAGIKKALDRVAGLLEYVPIGGKTRTLERELEAVRHFARPFAVGCRRLGAVEGAIDLDRGEPLGGVGEFLRMWQALGIEHSAALFLNDLADDATPRVF